jgi:hypothetical protein
MAQVLGPYGLQRTQRAVAITATLSRDNPKRHMGYVATVLSLRLATPQAWSHPFPASFFPAVMSAKALVTEGRPVAIRAGEHVENGTGQSPANVIVSSLQTSETKENGGY